MSGLVDRLRKYEAQLKEGLIDAPYLGEAADRIEEQEARITELEAQLERSKNAERVWITVAKGLEEIARDAEAENAVLQSIVKEKDDE